jgi:hypothetical protein
MGAADRYRYIHPDRILETFRYTESNNTQLIFDCPLLWNASCAMASATAGTRWCRVGDRVGAQSVEKVV